MTATPFRSDSKEVSGERIYRYPFRSATNKGYIKRLSAVYVSPEELEVTFTEKNSTRVLTLDEVLKLKESDWFSKEIAASEECNKSIVMNSIEKLIKCKTPNYSCCYVD